MKNFNLTDILTSIKCQFTRRCTRSSAILNKVADDLIQRYSHKDKLVPQFLKEDLDMAHNQLNLYSDQCISAMKKFDFLEVGAEIVHGITSASLKINEFLAQMLYQFALTKQTQINTIEQLLCSACGRLRQNQRVRFLREQLEMTGRNWESKKFKQMGRLGQKYDEDDLYYDQIDNLDSLNEERIKKRLEKMETDHNKRKVQMITCIQGLNRANQRVVEYQKYIKNSGKEFSDKFNIKDYVFKLGRHFHHNISNLNDRIQLLKHGLYNLQNVQTQTLDDYIRLKDHLEQIQPLQTDLTNYKVKVQEYSTNLTNEKRKNIQIQKTVEILAARLQQLALQKDKQILEDKVKIAYLEADLISYKMQVDKIINDNLIITKIDLGQYQDTVNQIDNQQSLRGSIDDIRQRRDTKLSLMSKSSKKQSILVPITIKHFRNTNSNSLDLNTNGKLPRMTEIKNYLAYRNNKQHKMCIYNVLNETYKPILINKIKFALSPSQKENDEQLLFKSQFNKKSSKNIIFRQNTNQKKKLSKIDSKKHQHQPQSNSEMLSLQQKCVFQTPEQIAKKKTFHSKPTTSLYRNTVAEQGLNTIENLQSNNTLNDLYTRVSLISFSTNQKEDQPIQHFRNIMQKNGKKDILANGKTGKKQGHENNLKQRLSQQKQLRLEKLEHKYSQLGEKERQLLLGVYQKDGKTTSKISINRKQVLSLEQINYSTNFCSLLANLHLKDQIQYDIVRKFMLSLIPGLKDSERSLKQSLKWIIIAHRGCESSICRHLSQFLQRIRSL